MGGLKLVDVYLHGTTNVLTVQFEDFGSTHSFPSHCEVAAVCAGLRALAVRLENGSRLNGLRISGEAIPTIDV